MGKHAPPSPALLKVWVAALTFPSNLWPSSLQRSLAVLILPTLLAYRLAICCRLSTVGGSIGAKSALEFVSFHVDDILPVIGHTSANASEPFHVMSSHASCISDSGDGSLCCSILRFDPLDPLPGTFNVLLLVPDICHTILLDYFRGPLGEVGQRIKTSAESLWKESMLSKLVYAQNEGRSQSLCLQSESIFISCCVMVSYLRQSEPLASPEEWFRVLQQRFNLLSNKVHKLFSKLLLLLFRFLD